MPCPLITHVGHHLLAGVGRDRPVEVSSSHVAAAIPVFRRMWGQRSKSVTVLRMYSRISGCAA